MRWSKLKGQMWGGATLTMLHEGHYYNTDMKVGVMSIRCGAGPHCRCCMKVITTIQI